MSEAERPKPELEANTREHLKALHLLLVGNLRQREAQVSWPCWFLIPAYLIYIGLLCGMLSLKLGLAVFVIGSLVVTLILFWGAVYGLALSYNYRCLQVQIRKLEHLLDLDSAVLSSWRRVKAGGRILDLEKEIGDIVAQAQGGKPEAPRPQLLPLRFPPEVLSVQLWFFLISAFLVNISSSVLAGLGWHLLVIDLPLVVFVIAVYILAAEYYPNKHRRLVQNDEVLRTLL
jgi:hypothetical protein